jgi:hypothetical protein
MDYPDWIYYPQQDRPPPWVAEALCFPGSANPTRQRADCEGTGRLCTLK